MRIRYSEFHPDPNLRGTINDKLPRHRALAAIDSGLATEIPYANYRERLAIETAALAAGKPAPVTAWAINDSISNDPSSPRFKVVRTSPIGETTYFDSPPSDAPPHVKKRFADLTATDSQAFADRRKFLEEQAAHREPSTPGLASVVDVARALVGRKQ